MKILENYWVIDRPVYGKEREILVITLEFAGISVQNVIRENHKGFTSKDFPYLGTNPGTIGHVGGWRSFPYGKYIKLTYDDVMEQLHKIIKNERDNSINQSQIPT